ncbi:hypothetical protein RvY_11011 [Ramazzottius varieornatus]|uniref:Uncharacterized protein n=1 Tax=Ramazzottius varieornatus TaxID=947166 RepID=A0A1D1VNM3_RAMVA|nr:hypothetical protein RvY_11011 [Ramazzottius varieornatus]
MVEYFELLVTEMAVEKRSFSRTTQFTPEANTFRNWCAAHIVNKIAEVAIKKKVVTVD